jgi:hypothetical protein
VTAGDQFNSSDQGTVSCGTTCYPIFKVTATAGPLVFGVPPGTTLAQGEFVKLTNSASVGLADGGIENPLGRENLEVALASEIGTNTWLGYCGNVALTTVVPQPPLTNQTRNSTSANVPLKFALTRAGLVAVQPPAEFTMESVGNGDAILPPDARTSDDACYQIHIPPSGGAFKDVTDVTLTYDFVLGAQTSSYPMLASAGSLNYVDCSDACFRAYVSLQDKDGVFQGRLIVYLGNSVDFRDQHANGTCCSGDNLVGLADARVDASQMLGKLAEPCCMSFDGAQSPAKFGKLFVRAFVVVLDQGAASDALNHRLVLHDASFNGSHANQFLQIAGQSVPSCDWPPLEGLRMAIFKLPDRTNPVKTVTNLSIDPTSCQLRGNVTVGELNPDPNGSTYEVWVQQDGGVSLPNVGVMSIFAL